MRSFAFIILLAWSAQAHLQLSDPFPIRSSLNPAVPNDSKDYSYINPLAGTSGLPYPCKGYLDSDESFLTSQKTWSAGSSQTFTIAGTANHGGGSCQLSLSYDMGRTWNVIQSQIGGCMADATGKKTEKFVLPALAPNGKAVFSWSWFNKLGNREMYQNCVMITITNGGSGLNSKDHPAPFVANAGSINQCSTVDSREIAFPNPGKVVMYGGDFKSTVPSPGMNVVGTGCSHPGGADGAGSKGGGGGSGGDAGESAASGTIKEQPEASMPSSSMMSLPTFKVAQIKLSTGDLSSSTVAGTDKTRSPLDIHHLTWTSSSTTTEQAPAHPGSPATTRKCRARKRSISDSSIVSVS